MAFDAARARIVLFGGASDVTPALGDTWLWDGGDWTELHNLVLSPPARNAHAMAFDAARGVVVLFGGNSGTGVRLSDTWEWDGTNWSLKIPLALSPGGRDGHDMAYDPIRGVVVLYGGWNGTQLFADTWEWDGTSWTNRSSSEPGPRVDHRMAFDPGHGRVVLFGGRSDLGTYLDDTWEWDGTHWLLAVTPTELHPSARDRHVMATDPQRGVVLFGGVGPTPLGDIWRYFGGAWSQPPVGGPAPDPRGEGAMVFDTPRVECVLFGGNDGTGAGLGDTWGLGFYASCVSMGQGCTGSNGLVPLLDCTPPILGQSWTIVVSNLPVASGSCSAGQPYLMWAFPPPIHFELDLTPYHAPGCQLSLPWIIPPIAGTNDNGVATWVVPLPNDKAFLGIPLVIRGLVVDPCANQLMVTTSNYAVATFGSR